MTRIKGLGDGMLFAGPEGADWDSVAAIGGFEGFPSFQLEAGECVIPAGTFKDFYTAQVTVTGTFTGTFCNWGWEDCGPDKDGWEPRARWDR